MNALDQAFIKAFSKNRALPAESRETAGHGEALSPAAEVEKSASLVLHESHEQGGPLRMDPPARGAAVPKPHIFVPVVECIQTYSPEDFESTDQPAEELRSAQQGIEGTSRREEGVSDPRESGGGSALEKDDIAGSTLVDEDPQEQRGRRELENLLPAQESGEVEHRASCSRAACVGGCVSVERTEPDLGSDWDLAGQRPTGVAEGEEAEEEASPSARRHIAADAAPEAAPDAAAPPVPQDPEPEGNEVTPWQQCQPHELLVATELQAPELMTLHWGEPVGSAESFPEAPCWSVGQCLPHFDPQLLAEQDGESHVSGTVSTQQQPADDEEPVATLRSADPGSAPGEGPIVPVDEEAASPDAPRSQPPLESPPQPRSFTPAWEVDAFRWPELCGQLDEQTGGRLSESGEELQAAARDGLGVLAVTSCNRLEGRTTIALSLARAAASAGARVALVDADADHPQLARRLGMEAPCDWQEVVRLGQPLSEAAVVSLSQRVTLFPKAAATETHVQALTQPLLTVLEELTGHFDLVIVDLPPLEMDQPNETPISPCPIDMAVVARHVRCTSPEQAMAAAAALRSLGVRAVGVIENFGSPASGESSNSDRQSNAPGSD